MTIKNKVLALLLMAGWSLMPVANAEGDPKAGQQKAETCIGCHGIEGYKNTYPTFRVPRLKGQHANYIIASLKAYRSGTRSHPTMRSQAGSMTDQDMQDIAAYIASLKCGLYQ